MKKSLSGLALLFSVLVLSTLLQAEPVLAGHSGLKGQTLNAEGVKAVLFGKRIMIGDSRVIIVIARVGDPQDAFFKAQVGMTTSQFQTHWRRLFMTGGGSAPKIVETEADALKVVEETPGSVAVVDSANANGLTVLAK